MAEEHGFQHHQLCVNNCGLFGSRTTKNYCPKCYHDIEEKKSDAKSIVSPKKVSTTQVKIIESTLPIVNVDVEVEVEAEAKPNRCIICRKKVGLMGFKCRCGTLFCGTHRYPEVHVCIFDFKSIGREVIAKENPLVKAEKLEKI